MKSQLKNLDAIQIVGFVISATVSIGLLIAGQDKVASVTLGFVLAILTQLFDIQKRLSDSEERLLQANALSQALYRDEWLFEHIRQIVEDYQSVRSKWFELFKRRAEDAVIECRNVLHSMAEDYLIASPESPFTFGAESLAMAKKSLKAVAAADITYWRSAHAQKYLQANAEAVKRGVRFTRVFVQTPDTLRGIVDILEQQQSLGIDVYVAFPDSISRELNEDYII
ncbi:MAG: hypothetical protein GY845_28670 [Planctomycetes bacterium]|nr:hypothetical protein [Planctomycetota bacterium]